MSQTTQSNINMSRIEAVKEQASGVYSTSKPFPWWLIFTLILVTAYFAKPIPPERGDMGAKNKTRVVDEIEFYPTKTIK